MSQVASSELVPLPPMPQEPRQCLAAAIVESAKEAFGAGLLTAIGKGSAFKGDFIPYYSDFDVHLFVDSRLVPMLGPRTPSLQQALKSQSCLGRINPESFQVNSIQVFVIDALDYPKDWTPPLPGTYRVLYGNYPTHFRHPFG